MISMRRQDLFLARWDEEGCVSLANASDIIPVTDLICSERNVSRKDLSITLNVNGVFEVSLSVLPSRFCVILRNIDGSIFTETSWRPFVSHMACEAYRITCRDNNPSKSVSINYCWQD